MFSIWPSYLRLSTLVLSLLRTENECYFPTYIQIYCFPFSINSLLGVNIRKWGKSIILYYLFVVRINAIRFIYFRRAVTIIISTQQTPMTVFSLRVTCELWKYNGVYSLSPLFYSYCMTTFNNECLQLFSLTRLQI